jgi:hypothetical protein
VKINDVSDGKLSYASREANARDPQAKPLIDRALKPTVRRLDITVLVRVAGEVVRRAQTVMVNRFPIPFGEVPAAALREFMGRRRQIIGAVLDRYAAEPLECRLHAGA